jgi:hypothetical protein
MFVAATGFAAGDRGLELVAINIVPEGDEIRLLRRRGPVADPPVLRDPVVLMQGRMRLRFTYRDRNGLPVAAWTARPQNPSAVDLEIMDMHGRPVFPVAISFKLAVDLSADCLAPQDDEQGRKERCPNASQEPQSPDNEPRDPKNPRPQKKSRQ